MGISGAPFVWDTSNPISYRVESGPLSQKANGGTVVIDNAHGVTRVQNLFGSWSALTTANLNVSHAGGLLAVGSFPANGDVKTVNDFLAVAGEVAGQNPDPSSCNGGGQSPIMFDADGSIFDGLGLPPEVIGFAFACAYNPSSGKILSAGAILNGRFQDGVNNSGNFELTSAEFDQAFTHEFGHFLGLGHSQINVDLFLKAINNQSYSCSPDDTAGMPLMFPVIGLCPAKVTAGVPILGVDDAAWMSKLYPVPSPAPAGKSSFSSAYGTISGTVYFSDGVTPAQGVNIIARSKTLPRRNAVSAVSGYLYTGNPGQLATCVNPSAPTEDTCSNLGDPFGSHDSSLLGHFDIPLPPGTYTLSVESVFDGFTGGSSVGPLDPPIPAPGTFSSAGTVTVTAGGTTAFNITLQGTQPRFDAFESAALSVTETPIRWLRRELLFAGLRPL
ncbi:MAG TPA: matrixin family metalloprotease [Candidatus Saccharimonadales bacterium]|nr:matrixin family metalloprotease [Candidatus Saccharimonadales bacterium]